MLHNNGTLGIAQCSEKHTYGSPKQGIANSNAIGFSFSQACKTPKLLLCTEGSGAVGPILFQGQEPGGRPSFTRWARHNEYDNTQHDQDLTKRYSLWIRQISYLGMQNNVE